MTLPSGPKTQPSGPRTQPSGPRTKPSCPRTQPSGPKMIFEKNFIGINKLRIFPPDGISELRILPPPPQICAGEFSQ